MEQIKNDIRGKLQEIEGCYYHVLQLLETVDTPEKAEKVDSAIFSLSSVLEMQASSMLLERNCFRRAFANRNVKDNACQRLANYEVESSNDYQRAGIYVKAENYF